MNKTNKRIWLSGFAIIVFFAAVFGLHRLLQEPAVHTPLRHVFKTYDVSSDGNGGKCVNNSDKPFERIEAGKMNSMGRRTLQENKGNALYDGANRVLGFLPFVLGALEGDRFG